jgi:hypothetical protein
MTTMKGKFDGFRTRRLGDLRHLKRCHEHFGGPLIEGDLEAMVFVDSGTLGEQLQLTNAERERHRLYTIKPYDMTDEQLAEQRRAKKRKRDQLRRRRCGMRPRTKSGTYQEAVSRGYTGSRATFYRDKRRDVRRDIGVTKVRPSAPTTETECGNHSETECAATETENAKGFFYSERTESHDDRDADADAERALDARDEHESLQSSTTESSEMGRARQCAILGKRVDLIMFNELVPAQRAIARGEEPIRPIADIERDLKRAEADYERCHAAMTPEDWEEFGRSIGTRKCVSSD